MLSDITSASRIPHSTTYLALYVQIPEVSVGKVDVDEVLSIYVRDTLEKGPIQKITETSLRIFLMSTPLMPSKKWYDFVKIMEVPKKGEIAIHFWLPRDHDLSLGVLDQHLEPYRDYAGILATQLFSKSGIISDFRDIQSRLTQITSQGLAYQTCLKSIFLSPDNRDISKPAIPSFGASSSSGSQESDDSLTIPSPTVSSPRRERRMAVLHKRDLVTNGTDVLGLNVGPLDEGLE